MSSNSKQERGVLRLEKAASFEGSSFGYPASRTGEVVFTTGMVGYPETLTDPSYRGQILVFTSPLVGNYGVPLRCQRGPLGGFFESERIQASAVVVQEYVGEFSHWASRHSLGAWLKRSRVPAITGVDTRALTLLLRERGVMLGALSIARAGGVLTSLQKFEDPNLRNLVSEVSLHTMRIYKPSGSGPGTKRVLLYDCGVKYSIIRALLVRGCEVIRVPWDYDLKRCRIRFDGIVVSNGPGDPNMCTQTIASLRYAIAKEIPTLGICLGNQLLALAAGARTYKLKYGHRSHNQPCLEVASCRCYITTQNHGYAIKRGTLPAAWQVWFENLNDGTIEGIRHRSSPLLAVQFHPEGHPGPADTQWVFDVFLKLL